MTQTPEQQKRAAEAKSVLGSGLLIVLLAAAFAWLVAGPLEACFALLAAFGGLVAAVGWSEWKDQPE